MDPLKNNTQQTMQGYKDDKVFLFLLIVIISISESVALFCVVLLQFCGITSSRAQ